MEIFLIILAVWVGVYWLPNLAIVVYLVRKDHDINLEDLLAMIIVTAAIGPIVTLKALCEYLLRTDILATVVFKKCPKREVWKALGGDEKNGP